MFPLTAVSCDQGVQMSCFEVRNPRDAKTDSIPQTKHQDGRTTLRLHPDKNPPEAQLHGRNSMDLKAWDHQDFLANPGFEEIWRYVKPFSDKFEVRLHFSFMVHDGTWLEQPHVA